MPHPSSGASMIACVLLTCLGVQLVSVRVMVLVSTYERIVRSRVTIMPSLVHSTLSPVATRVTNQNFRFATVRWNIAGQRPAGGGGGGIPYTWVEICRASLQILIRKISHLFQTKPRKSIPYIRSVSDDSLASRRNSWKWEDLYGNSMSNIFSSAVVKISASQSWGPQFDSRPGRFRVRI